MFARLALGSISMLLALLAGCASGPSATVSPEHAAALARLDEASRQPTQREAHALLRRAVEDLERQVHDASDPLTKALLAETLLIQRLQDDATRVRSRSLASAALAQDARAARAHSAMGWLTMFVSARFADAIAAFERALELDPQLSFARFGYGLALAASGDLPRGLAEVERAESSDLLRSTWRMGSQSILFFMKRYPEAAARARMPLPGSPTTERDRFWEGIALMSAGDTAGAVATLEERVRESNRIPGAVAALAAAYAADGQRARARNLVAETDKRVARPGSCSDHPCYLFAIARLAIGDRAGALAMLERAVNESVPGVWYLWAHVDPRLDGLRQDPRFRALLDPRIGPPASLAP